MSVHPGDSSQCTDIRYQEAHLQKSFNVTVVFASGGVVSICCCWSEIVWPLTSLTTMCPLLSLAKRKSLASYSSLTGMLRNPVLAPPSIVLHSHHTSKISHRMGGWWTGEWMGGWWTGEWMGRWWTGEWMGGWWTGEWMDGCCTSEWMGGWVVDRWMNGLVVDKRMK